MTALEATTTATCHEGPVEGTVVVVDDDAGFRFWMRQLLDVCGYRMIGEAGDGASGLAEVLRLRPEVVLVDVQLPDMPGFDVARQLSACDWSPTVVLVSVRSRAEYGRRVDDCGARGFVAKERLSHRSLAAFFNPV